MKKVISLLCALTLMAVCVPVSTATAAAADEPEVYAVVTTDDGETLTEEAPAAEELDDLDSYELYVDGKNVMSVGSNAESESTGVVIPVYYSVDFMIPDTTLEVYLTGLRSRYVEEIQQAVIDSYVDGKAFDLADFEVIDTEKTARNDGDEYLCWAAACSNVLTYTGWAAKAGFQTEDDVFDVFAKSFTDDGGMEDHGFAWFFNGAAMGSNNGSAGARIKNYPNSGGYLKSYAYDMVSSYISLTSADGMNTLMDCVKDGYGATLGITLASSTSSATGAHAVTFWGAVVDTALPETDLNRYQAIFITDSDSDMLMDPDRREAQKIMHYFPVYVNRYGRLEFDYYDNVTGTIYDSVLLIPYSADVPHETDLNTNRNKTRNPDLSVYYASLNPTINFGYNDPIIYQTGTKMYPLCYLVNAADVTFFSTAKVTLTVTDSNGASVHNETISKLSRLTAGSEAAIDSFKSFTLPAGDYTATYTAAAGSLVKEAYRYNNTCSYDFKVRDTYLSGDFNGDGVVDVQDATAIQEVLAQLAAPDAKAAERGMLIRDELCINDVTAIQEYLVDFPTDAPVGETKYYIGY